jgi:hypothetical protein
MCGNVESFLRNVIGKARPPGAARQESSPQPGKIAWFVETISPTFASRKQGG